jgi:AcrR family transcriptional regulator
VARPRTVSDDAVLDAALAVVREAGPDALSFGVLAPRAGLAASTIVQRFGTKPALLQAALARAWDGLDADTARADAEAGPGVAGVVDLLVALSGQYDEHGEYADGLRVLREDLRDPVLRERGRAWIATLVAAVERRLADATPDRPGGATGLGEVVVAHWQGSLIVWGFTRNAPLPVAVRRSLEHLLLHLTADARGPAAPGPDAPDSPATAPAGGVSTAGAQPPAPEVPAPGPVSTANEPVSTPKGKRKKGKGKRKAGR